MAIVRSRGMRVLLGAAALLLLVGLGGVLGAYLAFVRDLPDLRSVEDYRPPLTSRVLDRSGRLIGEFFLQHRELTPFDQVPDHVVRAFVAGEDSTFFQHSGIDFISILRAAWVNLRAGGEIKQGGSTITQQVVKGLLLSPERSYRRKIREMILARDLERRFTKQEILHLYLNQIYFGHGAYGIGEAARVYFGKEVKDLSVSEGALLAGLPQAPSRYSPFAHPDLAEGRRRYVLERMHADGFLDDATYQAALADRPVLAEPQDQERIAAAAYFTEEVRRTLFDALGADAVLQGGLAIQTTLDSDLQLSAQRSLLHGLTDLSKRQGYRGPLRHVEAKAVPAEIERVAVENGLAPKPADAAAAAASDDAETSAEAPAPDDAEEPARTPDHTLVGVVTRVDVAAKKAQVAFAPGVLASVALDDVAWARQPDPERAPYLVASIDKVFHVGDVARFERISDAGGDAEARVNLYQEPLVEGALLSIDLARQEVLTLVGGYDFRRSQFDRVTQARRQPGSSFKPFIYGAALEKGYTTASIVFDRPVVYTDERSGFVWRPSNYGRAFYGPITLREAIARSVNNATVHLFRDVGVDFVIDYARRLGIESPLSRDLSLALGSSGVSLLEITRAYSVFANQGRRVTPIFIRQVTDRDGRVLLAHVPLGNSSPDAAAPEPPAQEPDVAAGGEAADAPAASGAGEQVLSPDQAYLMIDLLHAVVVDPEGTGWRLRDLKRPVAGKTGTTNEQGDAWFIGFSPEIATGVWVGYDENRFLGWGETGSRAASPIWVEFMRDALASRPVRDFPVPDSIVFARIDRKTGLLADATSTDSVFQAFLADTVPTESAGSAETQKEGRRLLRMDAF
jgi:penicillin-binding protein 1A